MRKPLARTLMVTALALVTACGAACSPQSAPPTGHSGVRVALPTSDWTPDQMRFSLSVTGRLIADGTCIRLREKSTGTFTTPVWPKGSVAYSIGDVVTIFNAGGQAVARTGDEVTYDGGYGPAPYPGECTVGQTSFWLVQEDLQPKA